MTKILEKTATALPIPIAGQKVGYGRVSTEQQTETQQRAQLEGAGCIEVVTETISSGRKDRPGLASAISQLQPGDTLVICKLDRLARSLQELLTIAADLETRGIHLQVLDQAIDTTTNPPLSPPTDRIGIIGHHTLLVCINRPRSRWPTTSPPMA